MLQLETQRLPFTRCVDKLAVAAEVVIIVVVVDVVVVGEFKVGVSGKVGALQFMFMLMSLLLPLHLKLAFV